MTLLGSPAEQLTRVLYTGGLFGCFAVIVGCYLCGLMASYTESFMWLFPFFWVAGFFGCCFHKRKHGWIGFVVLILLGLVILTTPVIVE